MTEAIPFVPIPDSVVTFDDLMDFDRDTTVMFKKYWRPMHPLEVPDEARKHVGAGHVLVICRGPGVRARLLPSPTPGLKSGMSLAVVDTPPGG